MQTQITELLNSSAQIAQRQPVAIALLNQVYHELFNQTIQQGCGNCYQKAFYRIQKYLYLQQQTNPTNNILSMIQPHRKYLLKPDRSLQTVFGGDTLTNDNLTDEAAEKLLQAHPALIQHFDRYPSGDEAEKQKTITEEKKSEQFKTSKSAVSVIAGISDADKQK
jgi:hypothetical protein